MSKLPKISVIVIDYKEDNPYLLDLIRALKSQTYKAHEVILVTDSEVSIKETGILYKSYGQYVGPAKKRDDGALLATGDVVAFIDDDAYPHKNWLKEIADEFVDPSICAVGGPGVTPPGVSWQEEASGWASASPIGSGQYTYRFLKGKRQFVDDYPSMNLAVNRKDFLRVGGFDSNYWPGEDTKLCLDLVYNLGKKIIYNPGSLVYHHRRPILIPHLRQNGNFGLHRGFFARVLPTTSFKAIYFGPSLLLIALLLSPLILKVASSFASLKSLVPLTLSFFILYFSALILNSFWVYAQKIRQKSSLASALFQATLSLPIIFVTHLWYGARFLQGFLFTDKLLK